MEPHDSRYNRGRRQHLRLVGAGAVLLAVVAMACHPWDRHLSSVHEIGVGQAAEEFCTQVNVDPAEHPGVTEQAVNDWVKEALYLHTHVNDWESILGARFENRGSCGDYTPFELEDIELHYRVNEEPWCGDIACTDGFPFPCPVHVGSGHNNCNYFEIVLDPLFFEGSDDYRNHGINHETGHALGLADPECVASEGNCQITNDADHCWLRMKPFDSDGDTLPDNPERVVPLPSIMHTTGYCCPDLQAHQKAQTGCEDHWPPADLAFPNSLDRLIAQLIADNHPWVSGD